MRRVRAVAWRRLVTATRLGVQGRRRYRVWWRTRGAQAVHWRADGRPASCGRLHRWYRRHRAMVAAGALGTGCIDARAWLLLGVWLALGVAIAWLRMPHRREAALRREGARAGPWVWAIDANSAIRTAEIASGLEARRDQARRMPSMRIQSPSCSHASSSNQSR